MIAAGLARHRITDRDLEVLEFVARFGLVPGAAAARWAGTSRSVTYRREARWREHGLVRVLPSGGRLRAAAHLHPRGSAGGRPGGPPPRSRLGWRSPARGHRRVGRRGDWNGGASGC